MRLAVVSEGLQPPFDEGFKKSLVSLLIALRGCVDELYFYSNTTFRLEGIQVAPVPTNKLLWGHAFARNMRQSAPDALLYLPASGGTPASLLRGYCLKVQSGGRPLAMFTLQPKLYASWVWSLVFRNKIDLVFSQSMESVQQLEALGFKTRWLPGGVDLDTFRPVDPARKQALRLKFGIQNQDKVWLHVGHINRQRNISLLARLARQGQQVIVIGSTSTVQDSQLLDELKGENVRVLPDYIEHIEELYQAVDGYIFPVENKNSAISTPLSVLEAMACNLPVLTTAFGALPVMFKEGNGLFFIDASNGINRAAQAALRLENIATRNMVEPYHWDAIARKLVVILTDEVLRP